MGGGTAEAKAEMTRLMDGETEDATAIWKAIEAFHAAKRIRQLAVADTEPWDPIVPVKDGDTLAGKVNGFGELTVWFRGGSIATVIHHGQQIDYSFRVTPGSSSITVQDVWPAVAATPSPHLTSASPTIFAESPGSAANKVKEVVKEEEEKEVNEKIKFEIKQENEGPSGPGLVDVAEAASPSNGAEEASPLASPAEAATQCQAIVKFKLDGILAPGSFKGVLALDGAAPEQCTLVSRRCRASSHRTEAWEEAISAGQSAWKQLQDTLRKLEKPLQVEELSKQAAGWRNRIAELQEAASQLRETYQVLFLGPSGAGKSKLLTSAMGEEDLLPSAGEGSAVTAAPIELRYSATSPAKASKLKPPIFQASVKLVFWTTQEFDATRQQMLANLCEYWRSLDRFDVPAEPPDQEEDAKPAQLAYDWLVAVYGKAFHKRSFESEDELRQTLESKTPKQVGSSMEPKKFHTNSKVSEFLRQNLVQGGQPGTPQVWPLVARAMVSGPWRVLQGACFVDLPGVGDSNTARGQVAARYLSQADMLVICTAVDRAATQKESVEYLRKGLRDLPAGSVFYVATKSDSVNRDEVVKAHKLPERTSKLQATLARNETVKKDIRKIAPGYEYNSYTVSVEDWRRNVGLGDVTARPQIFKDVEQTELPQLLKDISVAIDKRKEDKRLQVVKRLHAWLVHVKALLSKSPAALSLDAAQFHTLLSQSMGKLAVRLLQERDSFRGDSDAIVSSLREAVGVAGEHGRRRLPSKARYWGVDFQALAPHWASHNALVNRDGVWQERGWSMTDSIATPMVDKLDQSWISAFNGIPQTMLSFEESLADAAKDASKTLASCIKGTPAVKSDIRKLGESLLPTLTTSLRAVTTEAEEELAQQRRNMKESIEGALEPCLVRALSSAKRQSGPGSAAARRREVTCGVEQIPVKATLAPTSQRVQAVQDRVAKLSEQLSSVTEKLFQETFASYFDEDDMVLKKILASKIDAEAPLIEEQLKLFEKALQKAMGERGPRRLL